jgi:hypothetical protein
VFPFLPFGGVIGSAISDALMSVCVSLADFFESIVLARPRLREGDWSDYLYGNAIGLSQYLAVMLLLAALCLAYFYRKGAIRAIPAMLIAALVVPLSTAFFLFCDQLIRAGDQLAQAAHGLNDIAGGGKMIMVPTIGDPIWAFFGLLGIGVTGGALTGVMIFYAVIIVVVKFATLIMLVLSPFFKWARRQLEWCISMALVAMLAGPPVAILLIEVGKILGTQSHTLAIAVPVMVFTLGFAVYMQVKLIKKTHEMVGNVIGRTMSNIRGTVESIIKPNTRTNMQAVQSIHMRGMVPATANPRLTRTQAAGLAARQVSHTRKVAAVGALAARTASPHVRTALLIYQRAVQNRPPQPHRIRKR